MAAFAVQLVDLVKPGAPGHIHLAAQNGLDAPLFCRLIKFDHAVHTAVVGDGHRRLAHFLGGVQKPLHAAGAVEQAVFRVYMQVAKAIGPSFLPQSELSIEPGIPPSLPSRNSTPCRCSPERCPNSSSSQTR